MTDPGWLDDPSGRHQHRYWDGQQWTPHVADAGVQGVDEPSLEPTVATPTPPVASTSSIPVFGARKVAQRLAEELEDTRQLLNAVDGLSLLEVRQQVKDERAKLDETRQERDQLLAQTRQEHIRLLEETRQEQSKASAELAAIKREIVETQDLAMLQEAGIYDYTHPLADAVAFQSAIRELQGKIKVAARANGGAVSSVSGWTVNGSAAQGRKMVNETSKLMLRAYNAEADNLVRGLKPYKRDAAVERLSKVRDTIMRLGKTMSIEISPVYHRMRVEEIYLTADYVAKREEEKERDREEKARLREERIAQQEIERERARLEKEQAHYLNALKTLDASGDVEAAARLREQLTEIEKAIEDVDYRAANIRAGYVYVISNLGSFGPEVVKIGMTRRLDPQDRVRELGDASVPFRYDTHAMFFAEDAVTIENLLHKHFADRRINRVNHRREFFRTTPQEVKAQLASLAGDLLEFTEDAEAVEYRQSLADAPPQLAAID